MKNGHGTLDVRNELIQYIGALLTNTDLKKYSETERQQIVCATLVEEALKIVTSGGSTNLFVGKPILRAASRLLEAEAKDYEELAEDTAQQNIIKELYRAKKVLDTLVEEAKA